MKVFVFALPEKSITFTFGLSAAESRTKNRHRTFGDPPKNVQRSFTLFISRIKCAETDVHRFCELLVLPLARDSRNPRQPFFGWFCKVVLDHCHIRRTRTEEVIDLCDGRNRAYSSERRTAAKCHAIIKGSET